MRFDSKENAQTGHEPQLEVTLKSGEAVPTGAMFLWESGDCPTGYSLVTAYNDRFVVASGIAGVTGGSASHTHRPGTYVVPGHTHSAGGAGSATDRRWVDDNSGGDDHWVSGENHTHSFTVGASDPMAIGGTSGTTDSRPPYVTLKLCRKN